VGDEQSDRAAGQERRGEWIAGVIAANAMASTISGAAAGASRFIRSADPADTAATSSTNGPIPRRTARIDPKRAARRLHATTPITIEAGLATRRGC